MIICKTNMASTSHADKKSISVTCQHTSSEMEWRKRIMEINMAKGNNFYPGTSKIRPVKIEYGGHGRFCSIPLCTSAAYNRYKEKTNIGFFQIPSDTKVRKQWEAIISHFRRKSGADSFTINTTVVCEFHFPIENIKVSLGVGKKTLRPGSIPSIFYFPKSRNSPKKRITFPEPGQEQTTLESENEHMHTTNGLTTPNEKHLNLSNKSKQQSQVQQQSFHAMCKSSKPPDVERQRKGATTVATMTPVTSLSNSGSSVPLGRMSEEDRYQPTAAKVPKKQSHPLILIPVGPPKASKAANWGASGPSKHQSTPAKPVLKPSPIAKPVPEVAQQKEKRILVVPNHQQSVMSNLASLWKAGRLCDASISNGKTKVMVHKVVFGAVCPKLLRVFYGAPHTRVPMVSFPSTVSKEALLAFSEYMYNGVLELGTEILTQLKVIAKCLDMKDFEQLCDSQLQMAKSVAMSSNMLESLLTEPCSSSGLIPDSSMRTHFVCQDNTVPMMKLVTNKMTVQYDDSGANSDNYSNIPLSVQFLNEMAMNNSIKQENRDTNNDRQPTSITASNETNTNIMQVKVEPFDPDNHRYGSQENLLPPPQHHLNLPVGEGISSLMMETSDLLSSNVIVTNLGQTSDLPHVNESLLSSASPLSSSVSFETGHLNTLPVGYTTPTSVRKLISRDKLQTTVTSSSGESCGPYPIGMFTASGHTVSLLPPTDQDHSLPSVKKEYETS